MDNLFQNDDIASFIDDELPALTEERGPKLIARLNVVFDTAEAAARLDALYTADHKKADFYEALENRVISLLDVLGYSGSLLDVGAADLDPRPTPVNTSVVSTDWRRQIVNAMPALNPSGVPPAEYVRITQIIEMSALSPWRDRQQVAGWDRIISCIESVPALLILLGMIAQNGAKRCSAKSDQKISNGKRSGGGNRRMAYHDMLMMELAQTYKLIYGSTPKRDCIRGDRYGPADRWIETVMRIAGRRAEDRLQPQQVAEICLSEEASERIIETCSQ